jgi:hypothetical protein
MNRALEVRSGRLAYLGLLGLTLVLSCRNWNLPLLPDGLVTEYTFDGGITRASNPELPGFLKNGASYGTNRDGVPSSALDFGPDSAHYEIADHVKLRPSALTISLWLNLRRIREGDSSHLYYKSTYRDGSNLQYGAKVKLHTPGTSANGYDFIAEVNRGGCASDVVRMEARAVQPPFQVAQWHHFVSVYDGQVLRVYLDGVRRTETTGPAKPITDCPGGTLRFGLAYRGDQNSFDGLMDDIRLYDRALTEAEVKTLYRR